MLTILKILTVAGVLCLNIINSKSELLEAKRLCDCTDDTQLQQAIYELDMGSMYMYNNDKKDLVCICSEDKAINQVEHIRNKRTPCLTDLVSHFFGSNSKRPESRPPPKKKHGTSAPRQPTVETPTVQAPVAKAPTEPESAAKPAVTDGGDEAPNSNN